MTTRGFSLLLFLAFALFLGQSEAQAQSKTQNLVIGVPATIKANSQATFTATLSDSWNGTKLGSRMVAFSVGQENYLTNAGSYPTSSVGVATFRWTFTQPGRYRVVCHVLDGSGYLSQRATTIVTVN